ncbi:MAG: hypothetical protein Kow0031_26780 [Anaerolineae bacterium]
MNQTIRLFLTMLLFAALTGCNQAAPPAQPNTQATIDAAVAATDAAQAGTQATIDAAVAATTQAQSAATQQADAAQATIEAAVAATATAQSAGAAGAIEPTATTPAAAPPAEYAAMSEEELAALIDQTVEQAIAASEASAAAASQAASDGSVTGDEVQTVEVYVTGAEEAVALAEEMLAVYTSLYGTGLEELDEMEAALLAVAESTAALNATLQEIDSSLQQGLALAEETITQLKTTAQTVQAQVQQLQAVQQQVLDNLPETAPQAGSGDPQAALQSVFEFAAAGQQATGDGQISPEELAQLAQMAGAVSANLNATGNPQMQDLNNVIEMVNGHLEAGNVPQAQAGLEQLGLAATLATSPNQVADTPAAAIQTALEFAALGQQLAGGGQPTPAQLAQLAQLGANASAGLKASGMPQLQQLSGQVTDIAGKISVGQGPQAQMQLQQLTGSLHSMPGIELPQLPEMPGAPGKPSLPGRN